MVSEGAAKIRVLIADDESPARRRIRDLLRGHPDLDITAECSTGPDALRAIADLNPDLVFLDIQMPGLDGLQIATTIKEGRRPLIVFVTAYDQYAVRAFEVRAVDYLLKPFDRARFDQTIERARNELRTRMATKTNDEIISLLGELRSRPQYLDRILIKNNDRVSIIKTDAIDWIEAQGNYVRVHFGRHSSLLRETLSNLASKLDPTRFSRIHRSRLVNIDSIQELQPWSHRDYRVILKNGTQLTLSRSYRDQLYQLLGRR